MPDNSPKKQPGDFILDRYMPDADEPTREAARENLRRFALAIYRVASRRAHEEDEAASRDKNDAALK